MNALFTAYSLSRNYGGIFNSMRLLARALPDSGVTVAAAGVTDEFSAEDASLWGSVSPKLCPSVGPRSLGYAPSLPRVLESSNAELVHAHGLWTYVSRASHRHCLKHRLPYVVSPHGMLDAWALRHSGWKKRIALGLYEMAHLTNANCLHALCAAELEAIRAAGLRNPVCVIPVGVELPATENDVAPWNEKISVGGRVLFYFGRLHPKKGLKELVEAWTNGSATQRTDWHLVIAGWDQIGYESTLRQAIAHRPAADRIHFLGSLSETQKAACYAHADAFVLPSFSEGLPMVVLEAWAHAKPVLITPQCNLPIGYERRAALQIQPDLLSITTGLQTLFVMSASQRQEMGQRGRALIEEQFLWPKIAGEFQSVYAWISGQGGKPSCIDEV